MIDDETPKDRDILVSIMGGAGLYPLALGEASRVYQLVKDHYPKRRVCFAGISSGCWMALTLALGVDEADFFSYFEFLASLFDRWYKKPILYWHRNLEVLTLKLLADNGGYKKLRNRFYVGMTTFDSMQRKFDSQIVSEFDSDQDVVDAMFSSGHLLFYGRARLPYYRNKLSFDCGYSMTHVILDDHINILIKYQLRFDNKSVFDILPDHDLSKTKRLYQEGMKKFEANKNLYIEQIEKNQILPDSYYYKKYRLGIRCKKKRHTLMIIVLISIAVMVYIIKSSKRKIICKKYLKRLCARMRRKTIK